MTVSRQLLGESRARLTARAILTRARIWGDRATAHPAEVTRRDRTPGLEMTRLFRFPASFAVLGIGLIAVFAAIVFVVGLVKANDEQRPADAFVIGIQALTAQKLTLGRPEGVVLLVAFLALVRRARLENRAWRPGPVEVRPVEDATGDLNRPAKGGKAPDQPAVMTPERHRECLHRLGVEFREHLTGGRHYQTTTVPGDLETERIIEVFKGVQPSGRLASLAAVWAYLWPNRAYIVTVTLRQRTEAPSFGVAVTVRQLPRAAVQLDTQWSWDFERALRDAAYGVTAHILPRTRACRRPPWAKWQRKGDPMPMELMRDYQLAKRMVGERRYDEALTFYQNALLYDPDNVYLQYDVCQILERLQLYPDALIRYEELTSRLFPIDPHRPGIAPQRRLVRRHHVKPDDAFRIRYRYVAALSVAWRLGHELLEPDWKQLRKWMKRDAREANGDGDARKRNALRSGSRPWRATELADLRRRIADQFDAVWQARLAGKVALAYGKHGLAEALCSGTKDDRPEFWAHLDDTDQEHVAQAWKRLPKVRSRRKAVEQFFLHVARAEAEMLALDLERRHRLWWRRRPFSLTPVVVRLAALNIDQRIERFNSLMEQRREQLALASDWEPNIEELEEKFKKAIGYSEGSAKWMEHYVAACCYALPLVADDEEEPKREKYAAAAVRALERAHTATDDIDFVMVKRHWLLAGDPDLAGLRQYRSFRAFESRVYLHPQPATRDTAKYELYYYLRRGLEHGTSQLEGLWLRREKETASGGVPTSRELEVWFRRERRAWEVCARLGRFHKQWQTRDRALAALALLVSTNGGDPEPVAFPEAILDYGLSDIGTPEATTERIVGMEKLLKFLARDLGSAAALGPLRDKKEDPTSVLNNTRSWIWYAECWSDGTAPPLEAKHLAKTFASRAAVWAALRQVVTTPSRRGPAILESAIRRLEAAPPSTRCRRCHEGKVCLMRHRGPRVA